MKAWDKLSSAELSDAVQRLYIRIEQYEIHLAELVEGTRERRVAQVQIDRLWKRMTQASAALDRRIAESIGQDARAQVARTARRPARRGGTSGS
jgi:hypothetical protein